MTITPELGSNESLLLEVPDIKVKNVNFRLFLTNRRLILSENRRGGASSAIPVPVISSAVPGTGESGEPVLALTIKAPDGSDRRMMLGFTQGHSGGDRLPERDRLMHEIERGKTRPFDASPAPGAGRSEPPVRDFSPGMSPPRGGTAQVPRRPPDNVFRSPPPPPPAGRDGGLPYGNRKPVYGDGAGFQAPPPPSYDSSPYEKVAPQYARAVHRGGPGMNGSRAGGDFVYSPPSRRQQRSAPKSGGSGYRGSGGGYADTDSVYGTILGIIRSPEETFRQTRRKELGEVIPVLLVSLAIFAFGNAFFLGLAASSIDPSAYPALSGLADMGTLIFVAIEAIVLGVIVTAVTGILLHFGAYYEGFDEDINDSVRVAAYSSVPFAVGGIIPVFGIIIAPFWSIYLQYTGMRETFYMDSDQAIVAALVPAAVFVILFIITVILGEDGFSIFGGA